MAVAVTSVTVMRVASASEKIQYATMLVRIASGMEMGILRSYDLALNPIMVTHSNPIKR